MACVVVCIGVSSPNRYNESEARVVLLQDEKEQMRRQNAGLRAQLRIQRFQTTGQGKESFPGHHLKQSGFEDLRAAPTPTT